MIEDECMQLLNDVVKLQWKKCVISLLDSLNLITILFVVEMDECNIYHGQLLWIIKIQSFLSLLSLLRVSKLMFLALT